MPRCGLPIAENFQPALLDAAEASLPAQGRERWSSFEFAIDENAAAPLDAPAHAIHHRPLYAGHYLFNSMPCAYAWFHH